MDVPRQGIELLALEQTPPHPAPQCGIGEIVEDEDGLIEAPQLAYGPVEVVARAVSQQALEGDGGGRVASRKGGEELAHAIPVGRDPVKMERPLPVAEGRSERAIILGGIKAGDPLAGGGPRGAAKNPPPNREGRQTQT